MRTGWDSYFLEMARLVATRASCDRLHVGAVITRDHRVLATGYNGSLSGTSHCDDVGHLMIDGGCQRTIHAEANAVTYAARYGVTLDQSTLYVTHRPCFTCLKLVRSAGITRIVYAEEYRGTYPPGVSTLGLEHLP